LKTKIKPIALKLHLKDEQQEKYQTARRAHWNWVARWKDTHRGLGGAYHRRLEEIYGFIIPKGQKVLEIGCGNGQLLASLKPSYAVGLDFSEEMISGAKETYPNLTFITADAHDFLIQEKFDFIILSDLVNDLWDVQTVISRIAEVCTPRTRIIINTYSHLWELPLRAAQSMKLMTPTLSQNWLTVNDIRGLLNLCDFETIHHWEEVLCPLPIPFLQSLLNRFAVKVWPFRWFAMTNFIVARPKPYNHTEKLLVSVIVPVRNEAGNIPMILKRTPEMGKGTELVFVEGHSTDNTRDAITKAIKAQPERRALLFQQLGSGKGDAVRLGFEKANGDILMILDGDMTVPPEELPRFYDALVSGKGEFINGVRLVYPMEKEAMRFLNLLGNKGFSLAFTWLLGQPIKDTLCGTKVLWRRDYERISNNRSYFGEFDPFGDFDLLFGAAKLNLKICELPIRYRQRCYGSTNISRWTHGWLLLRMVCFAALRIKFV